MYYESLLAIDAEGHPARERPARQLLRNPYLLHQRISAAFGRDPRREPDAAVRVPRRENGNWVLFRVIAPTQRVLVRSGLRPDWDRAFRKYSLKESWLHLAEPPSVEERSPEYAQGCRLRFSVRANPTVKKKDSPDDTDHTKHKHGYRVSLCYPKHALAFLARHDVVVSDEEESAVEGANGDGRELRRAVVERALLGWLDEKGEPGGFKVEGAIPIQEGFRHLRRPGPHTKESRKPEMSLRSVLYEGTLEVTDGEAFLKTLTSGIGPGKAFGFGLLSVAPYE